ncbi:MAG: tRNA preQ1(34) S-adenosylmethionine ribosyltransferase-isomerase QueA [Clostridiales bacterium]|nr:tRNA preQ1(34) S-adenosylmethionine ribosyltransferase-isomerase QueA [Clostridiales bacterium]
MLVEDFDYYLPPELIAQEPLKQRDGSRLLILDKQSGAVRHSVFNRLGEELRPGDLLVLNDTKVLPARLFATKESGANIELLLLRQQGLKTWQCLARPAKRAQPGTRLSFGLPELAATVTAAGEEGMRLVEFHFEGDFFPLLERLGKMPLPPYIKKELEDQGRYQVIYAREPGSAAAPTAGLHFTRRLLNELTEQYGIETAYLTLHVGLGTFRPVKAKQVEKHTMHSEYYRLDEVTAAKINAARSAGRRVIAVGTTTVRTLESVAGGQGSLRAEEGFTSAYIYPGYRFKLIDGMITNFHLPKSTLIMLVSALAGREQILNAYRIAIEQRYRFFSFGDAMLIL